MFWKLESNAHKLIKFIFDFSESLSLTFQKEKCSKSREREGLILAESRRDISASQCHADHSGFLPIKVLPRMFHIRANGPDMALLLVNSSFI